MNVYIRKQLIGTNINFFSDLARRHNILKLLTQIFKETMHKFEVKLIFVAVNSDEGKLVTRRRL